MTIAHAAATHILVLGDSLSAGFGIELKDSWVAHLQTRLQQHYPNCQVINDSTSGATTQNGLSVLPKALQRYQPKLVIVELGGNDGLRGLPIKLIQQNLSAIVKRTQASGAKVLLLGVRLPPNYGRKYTNQFEQIFIKVARELNVPIVRKFLKDVADNGEHMQADGIHPNQKAQQQMLDNIWPKLKPLVQGVCA